MVNWTGTKVLVTGACGFIGSHLTERLVQLGARVRPFVYYNSFNSWGWLDSVGDEIKKEVEVFSGDIREAYSLRPPMHDVEVVFHLAALIAIPYSYISPASYVKTNVEGTLNVLQAALDCNARKVIHVSTSEVYGTAQYVPIDESHPLQPQSPYSATKIGADAIAESFNRSFGLPVAIARPFNTYGPRQSARAVIPTIISQILAGARRIRLGSLHPTRDLTYVKDTVGGLISVAEEDTLSGTATNIGSSSEISVGDLAGTIRNLMGSSVELQTEAQRVRPERSEVERLRANNRKLVDATGWQPVYSLEHGLLETISWMRDNMDRYKPNIYNL